MRTRRPIDNIFLSLSDPESALSRDKENVFCPMYTAQLLTDAKSLLVLGMSLSNIATDVGTIGPMIDQVQTTHGLKLSEIHADAAYASLLDLKACKERNIDIFAPVQENGLTKEKKASLEDNRIPREQFKYNAEEHNHTCPAGHAMPYKTREVKRRSGGTVIIERFQQSEEICQACPLAKQCLNGTKRRTIVRPIGQEIVEQQRAKMTKECAATSRKLRAQTIERTNADIKHRIGLRRFGSVTLERARNNLALAIFVLNLMTVRRLLIEAANSASATT